MKKFLIIGNMNAACYKDVFPYIKVNKVWFGEGKNLDFYLPDGTLKGTTSRWLTNIGKNNRKPLELTEHYSPEKYQKYDNYDAIEVGKVKNIPCDYYGEMGVPVTFLDKHCPEQFEIVGLLNHFKEADTEAGLLIGEDVPYTEKNGRVRPFRGGVIDGKQKYMRIIIRRRK